MVGSWDNANVVCAVLPACLKNGSNPSSFYSGNFPVYRGPATNSNESSSFSNYQSGEGYLSDGYIKTTAVETGVLNLTNSATNYTPTSSFTIQLKFSFLANFPAQADYFFSIPGAGNGGFYVDMDNNHPSATVRNLRYFLYSEAGSFIKGANFTAPTSGTREELVLGGSYSLFFTKNGTSLIFYLLSNNYTQGYKTLAYTDNSGSSISHNLCQIGNMYTAFGNDYKSACAFKLNNFIVYNKALSVTEVQAAHAISYDLGGLVGTTNGSLLNLSTEQQFLEDIREDQLTALFGGRVEATDTQSNVSTATNVTTSPSGTVVGEKVDYIFG